jgi:hypothetical protein
VSCVCAACAVLQMRGKFAQLVAMDVAELGDLREALHGLVADYNSSQQEPRCGRGLASGSWGLGKQSRSGAAGAKVVRGGEGRGREAGTAGTSWQPVFPLFLPCPHIPKEFPLLLPLSFFFSFSAAACILCLLTLLLCPPAPHCLPTHTNTVCTTFMRPR